MIVQQTPSPLDLMPERIAQVSNTWAEFAAREARILAALNLRGTSERRRRACEGEIVAASERCIEFASIYRGPL